MNVFAILCMFSIILSFGMGINVLSDMISDITNFKGLKVIDSDLV